MGRVLCAFSKLTTKCRNAAEYAHHPTAQVGVDGRRSVRPSPGVWGESVIRVIETLRPRVWGRSTRCWVSVDPL